MAICPEPLYEVPIFDVVTVEVVMTVVLNDAEIAVLDRQDPTTAQDGGFQQLLVRLQKGLDRQTRALTLTPDDLERIPRYAFDYQNGGWEGRLKAIFSRNLGPLLGR